MTFTLIDSDGEEDLDIESEVRAAFGTGRTSMPAPSPTVDDGAPSLRRILGTSATHTTVIKSTGDSPHVDQQADLQVEAVGPDESGSLLRPHPASDRLENQFTVVPRRVSAHHPASRGFMRRSR